MNKKNNILSSVNLCVSSVYLYVIVFLFTTISFSQVIIKADTTKIRIGEQFHYQIEVNATTGVEFYKLKLDSLKKLEVIKSHDIDTLKEKLIKKYTLTSFDSGRYTLPKQLVTIFSKPVYTDSLVVDVSTVAVDTLKQPLFPIKAIQHQKLNLKDYAKNYWWLLLLLPIIGFLIWYFFIRKKETEEERIAKIPPFEMAVQQLASLDKKLLWQNNKIKQYYSELTDIVRNYLEKELDVTALESTTNELVNEVKQVNNTKKLDISNKAIIKLKTLLQEADLVKFAKSKPFVDEIEMHRSYAESVISTVQPSITKYKEENDIEEELFEVTETEIVKRSFPNNLTKKQKRNVIIISIVTLFIIGGFFGGKMVYTKVVGKIGNYLDTASTKQLLNGKWQMQNFGNNTLTLETPVLLKEEKLIELPSQIQKLIVSMETKQYMSLVNQLQVMIMATEYIKGTPIDLDQAVISGNASLKAKPGVTDFIHEIEKTTSNNIEGRVVTGTYKDNGIPRDYKIFVFVKESKMWMISLGNKMNDPSGEKIIERIVESINISDAN